MARCVIVSTGGTIASMARDGTGYSPELAGRQVLDFLSPMGLDADALAIDDFSNILSQSMRPEDMLRLAQRVRAHLEAPEVQGVVVTHGTVVMEETAFLCDLLTPLGKPVVFTGAMLPINVPGSDGKRNLADALRVAMAPDAWRRGVMVCMNGEVHAARTVRKLHASALDAFGSPDVGPLAVVGDELRWRRAPHAGRSVLATETLQLSVDFVSLVSGMDDGFLQYARRRGARGLVIEGLPGMGAVTPRVAAALPGLLRDGIEIVLASRSPGGAVRPSSGGAGGSFTLHGMGVHMGGALSGPKIRLLLMAALGAGLDTARIAGLLAEFGAHDAG